VLLKERALPTVRTGAAASNLVSNNQLTAVPPEIQLF
jgi:hypothetical protein